MEERRRCTTVRQLELMLDFLEHHQKLALGRVRTKEACAVAARLWRECSVSLNAEGPARTSKEWSKVWNDLKCRVRGKLVSINASQRATGGGTSNAPTLTPLEERVASILGRDFRPPPNVRQDQFALYDGEDDVAQEIIIDADNESGNIIDADNESGKIIDADNESGNISPPKVLNINEGQIEAPAAVSPVSSLTGQAPSPQRDQREDRPVRQRRWTVHAPRRTTTRAPEQFSRSHLEEARATFHRIEELRAEAALKNAETQLLIAQNQATSAQALNTVADSFKLIAESIDRLSQKYCQQKEEGP